MKRNHEDAIADASVDWCPVTSSRVHSFYDYSYWNNENHPTCACGYVDRTRNIRPDSAAGEK